MIPNWDDKDDRDPWRAFEDGTREEPVSRAGNRRLWLVFVALAFVIFEVTANPSLALAFGCVKFGWADFRRARRLKRDDPSRVRGKVCARFSTAWGLWKVSIVAIALMFIMIVIFVGTQHNGPNAGAGARRDPPATMITACLLGLAAFWLSTFVSTFAVVSALRHGLKIWVGVRKNRVKTVLYSASVAWGTALVLTGLLLSMAIGPKIMLSPDIGFSIVVFWLVAIPLLIVLLMDFLERRIVARSPWECWGELPKHLRVNMEAESWERDAERGWEFDPSQPSW